MRHKILKILYYWGIGMRAPNACKRLYLYFLIFYPRLVVRASSSSLFVRVRVVFVYALLVRCSHECELTRVQNAAHPSGLWALSGLSLRLLCASIKKSYQTYLFIYLFIHC